MNLINEISALVKECGKVMLNADREKMAIDIKSGVADLVTEYDKSIQEQLQAGLKSGLQFFLLQLQIQTLFFSRKKLRIISGLIMTKHLQHLSLKMTKAFLHLQRNFLQRTICN